MGIPIQQLDSCYIYTFVEEMCNVWYKKAKKQILILLINVNKYDS